MAFYLSGVHLPHRKATENTEISRLECPKAVTLFMSMHIGKPAAPIVKVGDRVKIGTLVGEQSGFVSSPIYSSVSGKVTKVTELTSSNGSKVPAVVIESDGLMEIDEQIAPPEINSKEDFIESIRKSGIVGLGGAGFPTYVKFNVEPEKVEELIINGAECEPYITSDTYTMLHRADDMACAIELIQKFYNIKRVIIGIEANKKTAIASMKALAQKYPFVSVKVLPSIYPQGGEKVLVYHTTGKVVPEGKLPLDVGCIVCNCTTLASIGEYAKSGMPLVKKCVTVDGAAIKNPQNVIVPIGTPVSELVEFCGGFVQEPFKLLYGGPMMGVAIESVDAPILKNTNAILALSESEAKIPPATSCIRCGSCTNICPFGINPAAIAKAYEKYDCESMDKLGAMLCMECGCCSYVCPAKIPLVQKNRLAKQAIREEKAKEAKKQ